MILLKQVVTSWILVLGISLLAPAQSGHMDFFFKNKGTIPVKIAYAIDRGLYRPMKIAGWYTIEPGDSWSWPGDGALTYYFAFSIRVAGRPGVTGYRPSRESDGQSGSDLFIAVPKQGAIAKEVDQSDIHITGPDEILIPFAWKIKNPFTDHWLQDHRYGIYVEPSEQDHIAVYFTEQEKVEPKKTEWRPIPNNTSQPNSSGMNRNTILSHCLSFNKKTSFVIPENKNKWCNCVADRIVQSTNLTRDQKWKVQSDWNWLDKQTYTWLETFYFYGPCITN